MKAFWHLLPTGKDFNKKLQSAIETDTANLVGFEGVAISEVLGNTKFNIGRIEPLEQSSGETMRQKKWFKNKVG
jgi:hypothetical protein